jgi:hypothetical protein
VATADAWVESAETGLAMKRREFIKVMAGSATCSIVRQAILFAATLWDWPDLRKRCSIKGMLL